MPEQEHKEEDAPAATPAAPSPAAKNETLMGVLAYLGILIIIPFLAAKEDPFVKFHIKQGLLLFLAEIAINLVGSSMWQLWPLLNLVNLAVLVLVIIGMINVVNHRQQELPLIGHLAKNFTF